MFVRRLINLSNMDGAPRPTRVSTTHFNMALFLFLLVAVTASALGRYYDDDDDVFPVVVERRGGSPACRRCALIG